MKKEDYISGPHHYGWHFFGGLIFGAVFGLCIGFSLFDGMPLVITVTAVTSIVFAFICGRWGEIAWKYISDCLRGWSGF